MNLGTLNTIIALVVVLLVLSLIVQSIQTGLKKLLQLKSKQIVESIKDLYDQAISSGPRPDAKPASNLLAKVWFLIKGTKRPASNEAKEFSDAVLDQFKNIGRVNRYGKVVLDSLAKDDLLKILAKLELKAPFFSGELDKFTKLCTEISNLSKSITILTQNQELAASVSAQISKIRGVFAPLLDDVQALVDNNNQVNPKVVFGDLLQLSTLDINSVLDLVAETKKAVDAEIESRKSSPPSGSAEDNQKSLDALNAVAAELPKLSTIIGDVNQKFNEAIAPLRAKLNQVEAWFDTVTQSFDERYTRHMKTVSICISAVVVILLNANFFMLYRSISTNEVQRNLIADAGAKIVEQSRQAAATKQSEDSKRAAANAQTLKTAAEKAAAAAKAAVGTPDEAAKQAESAKAEEAAKQAQENAGATAEVNYKKQFEDTRSEVSSYVNTYEQFGFSPISTAQFKSFLWGTGVWTYLWKPWNAHPFMGWREIRNDKGVPLNVKNQEIFPDCRAGFDDCDPAWRAQTSLEWWDARKHDVTVLLGWAVMVLLLSVGAPFWQDTLESLFGVKNLLRQKSATQNVEEESGAGQTKQA